MKSQQAAHASVSIPADIVAKCDSPNQFEKFDNLVSALIAVPKSAIVKEETKWKQARARQKAKR